MHDTTPSTPILKRCDITTAGLAVSRAQWSDASPVAPSAPRGTDAASLMSRSEADPSDTAAERAAQICRSLAAALARERAALLGSLQPKLVELAIAIAKRVVEHQISIDPSVIERIVNSALATVRQANTVTVRVAPSDVPTLTRVFEATESRTRVVADSGIAPGGCVLETDWGDVDALIETRLARVADALSSPAPPETT